MDSPTPEQILNTARTGWLPEVRENIRCAVFYGSRAVEGAEPRPDSDLDIFLVTRQKANPVAVVDAAVQFFSKYGFRCDPFWYVETYFFEALDSGLDCTLWYHVFRLGRIVYADSDLLDRVYAALRNTSPLESSRRTIDVRRQRDTEVLQELVRNTDRILTEAILLAYCRATGLSAWDALPDHRRLMSTAVAAGIVEEDVQILAESLATLKRRRDIGLDEGAFQELASVRVRVTRFANDQISGRSSSPGRR